MRLGLKLTLSFLAVGLAGVALVALLASRSTEREFQQFIFVEYRGGFVDQLATYYASHQGWEGIGQVESFPESMPFAQERGGPPGVPLTVADAQGVVVLPSFGYQAGQQVPADELAAGEPVRVDGQVVGWVVGGHERLPASPAEQAFVGRIRRILVQGAIGAASLSLLLGIVLARALTRPIRALTAATHEVAEGHFDQKVSVGSKDELGQLATSFNQMSAELARVQGLRRQMTADIAHELRTPISIVLGHAEAVHEGVLPLTTETFEVIRDEALRLERMVEDLRTLSRADAGELTLSPAPTAPLSLLQQAAKAYRPQAEQKHIDLQIEVEAEVPEVAVDRGRMAQVLDNLLDNALRHTPGGGAIHLSAAARGDVVRIRVQDTGPGIAPDDLARVFERLYRADKSRQRDGGTGLGLAIARSIVVGHGGRIWAESEPGQGTTIVIDLPRGQRAAENGPSRHSAT
jgi:two-component system, OmpR family, sensor histidine kinase BaeS